MRSAFGVDHGEIAKSRKFPITGAKFGDKMGDRAQDVVGGLQHKKTSGKRAKANDFFGSHDTKRGSLKGGSGYMLAPTERVRNGNPRRIT